MALPTLDHRGLLPIGEHICRFAEIEQMFLHSTHRASLYSSVRGFIDGPLKSRGQGLRLFLGGSFFSDKQQPEDIEATVYLPVVPPDRFAAVMELFALRDQFKRKHRVDFFPSIQMPGQNDFVRFFQYVGPKTASAKGLDERAGRGVVEVVEWELG
ncbi:MULTISPECIES: DUF6932 family protein [Pseudomonas]|uniref:Uncharacterized protein n=1 Tax=Pseudomonas salomonii TaxID=191391 RepID=A0ABS9GT44_9PSED|nr:MULTISPECIES: hypothetical protein [Pseudomonas]MCF5548850.1 hypothetical protein [Pseudomonas salomonii]WLH82518.1 hypothetical protein PSH96_16895 [Pseudomonas sp. FP2338]